MRSRWVPNRIPALNFEIYNLLSRMLICPLCHGPLSHRDIYYICRRCSARYRDILGVPALVKDLKVTRTGIIDKRAIAELVDILRADTGVDFKDELKELFGLQFDLKDAALQIESSQFLSRMHASGCPISCAVRPREYIAEDEVSCVNADINISMALLVAPMAVPPSTTFGLQVIISNHGTSILSSTTEHPVYVSYFWENEDNRIEGLRTPLLIDLRPGARLTMPALVSSPSADDDIYRLRLMLVHEGIRWLEEASISIEIAVASDSVSPFDTAWKTDSTVRDYYHDHRAGIDLLRKWVDALIKRPDPKILELGGNASPLISELVGTKFNVDIDIFGLVFGKLKGQASVFSVMADGMNLPFPDRYFDVIITFSTFHHFSDPIGLLHHLKKKLAPRGLICLLCEPIGHVYKEGAADEFLDELNRGVNEQSFELWEYAEMVRRAGLEVADVRVDVGSLKIALKVKQSF